MLAAYLRERAAAALGVPAGGRRLDQPLTGLGLDSLSADRAERGGRERARPVAAAGRPAPGRLGRGAWRRRPSTTLPRGCEVRRRSRALSMAGDAPLSAGQRGLWFLHRLAPESGAYNIAVAARARELDTAALRARPGGPRRSPRGAAHHLSRWLATSRCSGCCRSLAPDVADPGSAGRIWSAGWRRRPGGRSPWTRAAAAGADLQRIGTGRRSSSSSTTSWPTSPRWR